MPDPFSSFYLAASTSLLLPRSFYFAPSALLLLPCSFCLASSALLPPLRSQCPKAFLPVLRDTVRITDFLNCLAADRIRKSAILHPLIHRFRLVDGKLSNQPRFCHLHVVLVILLHQRQQPVCMLPAQIGNEHDISPAADKRILRIHIFLCIAHSHFKIQLCCIANELIRVPPVCKQQILMNELHPLVYILNLLQTDIEINPVKLLLHQNMFP